MRPVNAPAFDASTRGASGGGVVFGSEPDPPHAAAAQIATATATDRTSVNFIVLL
jgi:hypothetical protein